jgi:hypothetical protein
LCDRTGNFELLAVQVLASDLEGVSNVDHPVRKGVGAVVSLLRRLVWIREGAYQADSEMLFDLPVEVGVEFKRDV